MTINFDPLILRSLYEQEPPERQRLVESCLAQVVEWRWASAAMRPQEPFWTETFGIKPPVWLETADIASKDNVEHGLDSQGRIHFSRNAREQACWIHEDGQLTFVPVDASKTLERVFQFRFDGDQLVLKRWFTASPSNSAGEIQYHWEDNRLVRHVLCKIDWSQNYYEVLKAFEAGKLDQQTLASVTPAPCFFQHSYEYADQGLHKIWSQEIDAECEPLKRPHCRAWITPELEYEARMPKGKKTESISSIAKTIERMLLEQIPVAVKIAGITSPVYCLLICYCAEDVSAGWPPNLILGLDSYRQREIEKCFDSDTRTLVYELYSPWEMEVNPSVGISNDELDQKCDLFVELMSEKENFTAGQKVLRSVAKQLNKYAWGGIVPVTDDFIVAAVDSSKEEDPIQDIKAVVPADRLALLRKRGLWQ